jgi:DNA-directed RNA polymerase subunit RPC12/RpoP
MMQATEEGREMAQIRELSIVCGFCGTKFHSKAFTESETLEAALTTGHSVGCPKCGKQILCNKSNTSYTVDEAGGTGGIDFS